MLACLPTCLSVSSEMFLLTCLLYTSLPIYRFICVFGGLLGCLYLLQLPGCMLMALWM